MSQDQRRNVSKIKSLFFTAGSLHVNSTNLPAATLQTELIFGTFTDHNIFSPVEFFHL